MGHFSHWFYVWGSTILKFYINFSFHKAYPFEQLWVTFFNLTFKILTIIDLIDDLDLFLFNQIEIDSYQSQFFCIMYASDCSFMLNNKELSNSGFALEA